MIAATKMNGPQPLEDEVAEAKAQGDWKQAVAPFRTPSVAISVWQTVSTFAGAIGTWYLAWRALEISIFLTFALDLVLAGFLVRLFILQHDCGHGSFFKQQWANLLVGSACGFVMMTPYEAWRHGHAIHHATTGDLDRRGTGDVMTWTAREYLEAPALKRFGYKMLRNPFVLLIGGVVAVFMVLQRLTMRDAWGYELSAREKLGVHITTVGGAAIWVAIGLVFGWKGVLLIHLPAAMIAAGGGIFLFYAQHQYEGVYWKRHKDWDYFTACMKGCSYLKLDPVLNYFSGSIGIHHIHHLAPKIPNYKLKACLDANPMLQEVTTFGFFGAVKTLGLKLIDEENERVIGWRELSELEGSDSGAVGHAS
jgi:omega-6 fatty acid desaturase (delta-12 desaturase)